MSRPILQIIVGSTRPGRVGLPVGQWFHKRAESNDTFDVEFIDLAEVELPLFDEPAHPRLHQYEHQHTKDWSATIDRGDAYVFVIPEYNYSINAATKNAVDYLFHEWRHKPAGFVSYGGISAGIRSMQVLKQSLSALHMLVPSTAVNIPFVAQFLTAEGEFEPNDITEQAAIAMLGELDRFIEPSKLLRASV